MEKFLSPDAKLKDFIKIYENSVDNDLCDLILQEYGPDDPDWQESTIQQPTGEREHLHSFRKTNEIFISNSTILFKNFETRKYIDDELYKSFGKVVDNYVNTVSPYFTISHDSGYALLDYSVGCHFKQHVDLLTHPPDAVNGFVPLQSAFPRRISLSLLLNEDYEGGDLSFFNNTYKIPRQKGTIVLFPSNTLFPHQVAEVTSGHRYSIITWFS